MANVTDKMFEALEFIAEQGDKGYMFCSTDRIHGSTVDRIIAAGLLEYKVDKCPTCGHEANPRWYVSEEGRKVLEGRP